MSENSSPPRPYGNGGLVFLACINIAAAFFIFGDILNVSTYRTQTSNSYTVAEAAYIGSLWSRITAHSVLLLTFNILMLGLALSSRIGALHRAVMWHKE